MVTREFALDERARPSAMPMLRKRKVEWVSLAMAAMIAAALLVGWKFRDVLPYTAEKGTGYWLGIAGLSCVGVLLLYPLRKRIGILRVFGSVPAWFRLHMVMGAVAPVLILYHSRFEVGSINAMVALVCMLTVAASGVIGRFLYIRIYRGVAGKKEEARRLLSEASSFREMLDANFTDAAEIAEDLEASLMHRRSGLFVAIWLAVRDSRRVAKAQNQMIAGVKNGSRRVGSNGAEKRRVRKRSIQLVRQYCESLRSAAQLEVFERLFSLWHVVHLPLFYLMLFAAVIHVLAVHLY